MLTDVFMSDLVLVERETLAVAPGFTALTGETGAGKSIVLGALGLALGGRADRVSVRAGADAGSACAVFDPPADHPARAVLAEAGVEVAQDEPILMRRTLGRDGRTRAFINDEPASVAALRALGDRLIEIHGQHDGRGLLDVKTHRPTLDRFAGADDERAACAQAWTALEAARARVRDADAARAAKADDAAAREAAAAEMEALAPEPGEAETLSNERALLQSAERLRTDLHAAGESLNGDHGAQAQLGRAVRALASAKSSVPAPALIAASEALERALIETDEACVAVEAARALADADPTRLDTVEERLFALRAAARKYGVEPEALHERAAALIAARDGGEGDDAGLAAARAEAKAALEAYDAAADALSAKRAEAAARLDDRVAHELAPLKLDGARFQTRLAPRPEGPGPDGRDQVRFEIATNPGAPFGPLERIASGGELSRFALALKVALADAGGAHVFIFDEVDQGVGGAVADAIGARLGALAQSGQVIVVTHSPQVAAYAHAHVRVDKSINEDGARTRLVALDDAGREQELARMLAGEQITDEARAAARRLRAAAR